MAMIMLVMEEDHTNIARRRPDDTLSSLETEGWSGCHSGSHPPWPRT
jgi:hypothetical protein